MARVTTTDLAFVLEWVSVYDPAPDKEGSGEGVARLCNWLQSENDRRDQEATIRDTAKLLGVFASVNRHALGRTQPAASVERLQHSFTPVPDRVAGRFLATTTTAPGGCNEGLGP